MSGKTENKSLVNRGHSPEKLSVRVGKWLSERLLVIYFLKLFTWVGISFSWLVSKIWPFKSESLSTSPQQTSSSTYANAAQQMSSSPPVLDGIRTEQHKQRLEVTGDRLKGIEREHVTMRRDIAELSQSLQTTHQDIREEFKQETQALRTDMAELSSQMSAFEQCLGTQGQRAVQPRQLRVEIPILPPSEVDFLQELPLANTVVAVACIPVLYFPDGSHSYPIHAPSFEDVMAVCPLQNN